MPRVASYGQSQVRPAAIPSARQANTATPESFGAGAFDVAGNVGIRALASRWQAERTQADEIALLDFDRQSAEWEHQRLNDPQTGVLNTVKGKDALGLSDTIGTEYDTFTGDLIHGLKPEQQLAAQKLAQGRRKLIVGHLDAYGSHEADRYAQETTDASLKTSVQLAIANATDPARVATELQRQEVINAGDAQHRGVPPEARDAKLSTLRTATHEGVINQLLTLDRFHDATTYFESAKDQITGDRLPAIEKALEEGTLRGESQKRSDAIMAGSTSMSTALDQARTIDDPKLRDEVQQRVEHEWTIRKQAARESAENLMVTAANQIDKGGIKAVPAPLWSQLEPSQRESLEHYAKRNQKGGEGESNLVTYYGLMTQASTEPDKFKELNLLTYLGKLSKSDFKHLTEVQASIRKGDKPKTDEQLDGFRTNEQIVNDTLDLVGIPRAGKDAEPETVARFRRTLDEKVVGFQRLAGKKATNADVQQLADDLLKSVTLQKGSWWGVLPGVPFRDVSKRLMDLTVADIPAGERRLIEQALASARRPVNDAAILNLYLAQMRHVGGVK